MPTLAEALHRALDDEFGTSRDQAYSADRVHEVIDAVALPDSGEVLHTLLWPRHPGGVYQSSALCSCGEWQFDSGSPHALFNETRLILSEWTAHAALPNSGTGPIPDEDLPGYHTPFTDPIGSRGDPSVALPDRGERTCASCLQSFAEPSAHNEDTGHWPPADSRERPGLQVLGEHTFQSPDGRLHCRCGLPELESLAQEVLREALKKLDRGGMHYGPDGYGKETK